MAETRSFLAMHAKQALVRRVRAVFNDPAQGERPVLRSDDALYPRSSVIWRVHGDVTTMMVGGVSALLLQMLHPAVLAGVWDHSNFRTDMLGRLRRTARFIAQTTFGAREQADAAIATVKDVHRHVRGTLIDGTPYRADDPHLLGWVHVTEAISFLDAWQRYGARRLTAAEEDIYFVEFAAIAEALGAAPVPRSRTEADRLIATMRPELSVGDRTREVARIVLGQKPDRISAMPVQALTFQAAVDLLPDWARAMHDIPGSGIAAPVVGTGTMGLARTLRWAFRE
ncbi:oxygenase MpaB family protein [Sphingomonas oryzagri]